MDDLKKETHSLEIVFLWPAANKEVEGGVNILRSLLYFGNVCMVLVGVQHNAQSSHKVSMRKRRGVISQKKKSFKV